MTRSNTRRTPLLLGGAGLALAAALAAPSQTRAEAFNGTPFFVRGSGNVDRSVSGVDTITITSSTAVIDWTLFEDGFGNALTFLPNGNTAYFQDGPGQGGFAVLNRLLPSTNGSVVVFQGTVISRLQDASGSFSNGGTVAFYSPTGILVGSTAVFDVGQLLLTTLDPDLNSFESYAFGGTLQLAAPAGSTDGITVQSGAQFLGSGDDSYLALVAPQIAMRGDAYINGSTAYVAGEQVNLRYADGLFDISIPVGTSVGTAIDHRGSTGGPSSTGAGDNHVIYVVARAISDPVTMLLRGNLGFDPATTAGVVNGEIILSAGYDVLGRTTFSGPVNEDAVEENITIGGPAQFTSGVDATATGRFSAISSSGAIGFDEDLTVRAGRGILMSARSGNAITVGGNTSLTSKGTIAASGDVTGGTISLSATGGATLEFGGNLTAYATPDQRDGSSTGGYIELLANGGTLSVVGDTSLEAQANNFFPGSEFGDGQGGDTLVQAQNGGTIQMGGGLYTDTGAYGNGFAGWTARGGSSRIVARSGGTVDILGATRLRAYGFGGVADGSEGVIDGGAGIGGLVEILADGGFISFGNTVDIDAYGIGRSGASDLGGGPGDVGGLGQGGQALVRSLNGEIDFLGNLTMRASGNGGNGGTGGAGIGGVAEILAQGTGTVDLTSVTMESGGFGGAGLALDGIGGAGLGGWAQIIARNGGDILVTGSTVLGAGANGGNGASGGDATGGIAGVYARMGSIAFDGSVTASTFARGGNATVGFGGSGGDALGGTSYIEVVGNDALSGSLTIAGDAYMNAAANGGIGGDGDGSTIAAGRGGDGTGGTYQGAPGTGGAFLIAGRDNATLSIGGNASAIASGFGGTGGFGGLGQSGGMGGNGFGGTAQAGTFNGLFDGSLGNGQALFADLSLSANGQGGQGGNGDAGYGAGGMGQGGLSAVIARGSRVAAGSMSLLADGIGGFGSTGGAGMGGQSLVGVYSGILEGASIFATARGSGGRATTGDGGDGSMGTATVDVDSSLAVSGDISLYSDGRGGFSELGAGGLGRGGTSLFTARDGANVQVDGTITVRSDGFAGQGEIGGDGIGGLASLEVVAGALLQAGVIEIDADGFGGSGRVTAGMGVGGDAGVFVRDADLTTDGGLSLSAFGYGGNGFDGADGGAGYGGIAGMVVNRGNVSVGSGMTVNTAGIGGQAVVGGDGGDGYGGRSTLWITGDSDGIGTFFADGSIFLISQGIGGSGGDGDGAEIAAGNGGAGYAGRGDLQSMVDPDVGTGSFLRVHSDFGQLTAASQTIVYALGQGGSGGNAPTGSVGGMGGLGMGGEAFIGLVSPTDGGPRSGFADLDSIFIYTYGYGGAGGLDDEGRYTGAGGDGMGGYAFLTSRGGRLSANRVDLFDYGFGGAGSVGGTGAGGQAGMATRTGGIFDFGNVSITSVGYGGTGQDGRGGDGIGGTAFIGFQDGTTTITGSARVDASGYGGQSTEGDGGDGQGGSANISLFNEFTGSGLVGGEAAIVADGIGGGTLSATGTGGIGTGGLAFARARAGGTMSFGRLSLRANGQLGFNPDGTQSGTAIGGQVGVFAESGGLLEAEFLDMNANGTDAAGMFELRATEGEMRFGGIDATALGGGTPDPSLIVADGGNILISGFAFFDTPGDIFVSTRNAGLIGGPTIDDPTASIYMQSGGTIRIGGDNDDLISFGGQDLFLRARQVNILPGARIGANFVGFSVVGNDAMTVLGGNGETDGFTLTQAELARIEAGQAYFSASFEGLASDNILVRDTVVSGSLDDGVSSLLIQAGGTVRVEGTLAFLNAAETDVFAINAPRLEVVTPGGIYMLDPQGTPSGVFSFFGTDFWMADASTIDRLREDVAFDGRDELLASVAAGSSDPAGYLRAGDILLAVGNSLLVRNTGTPQEPGGITVTGELTIAGGIDEFGDGTGSSTDVVPIDVFAFGRKLNEDGTFTTGEDFFSLINFTNSDEEAGEGFATEYAEGSQFNNCDINTLECTVIDPPEPPPEPEEPEEPEEPDEREEVLDEVEEEATTSAAVTTEPIASAPVEQSEQDTNVEFGADFPGLLNASLIAEDSSIDDPVTSGGDIALYGSSEDEDEEGDDEQ